jgi:lipopolysaccharide/colanic/teichoic acid biosynthesis glycosyltransferase
MTKRLFDIAFSFLMLLFLVPVFLIISLYIITDSQGGAFFRQIRVGRHGQQFKLWKFRTMRPMSEGAGQLTVGAHDQRITKAGLWLRKYKLDELPQLINVFVGEMSIVGPRPEVPKYVSMYNDEQRHVLDIRPGITDHASLLYFEENALLARSTDPERTYIEEVMPAKLKLNLDYIHNRHFLGDIQIILKTVKRMVS